MATLAIGGVGIFLLSTQTLVPLGISLTVISGTGTLGVVTFAIFRRCCGPSEVAVEEDDEEAPPNVEKKSQQENEVDSSYEFSSGEAEEAPTESAEKKKNDVLAILELIKGEKGTSEHLSLEISGSKKEQPETLIIENALLLAKTPLEQKVIQICQNNALGFRPNAAEELIPLFNKMSYEEIQRCFSYCTNDPSWFRYNEDRENLPPRRVISLRLIEKLVEKFDKHEKFEALLKGIEDENVIAEVVARAEGDYHQVEIGLDSPQGRLLLVLRENDKVISILQRMGPSSLSRVVANLEDAELLKILSLIVEFNSDALATKEQIEKENRIREEKICCIVDILTKNAWKDAFDTRSNLDEKKITRSWAQLIEVLKVLGNVSSDQFALALMGVLRTMDEKLSQLLYRNSSEEVQAVIEKAEKDLLALVEEIRLKQREEYETSLREILWKWRVEEIASFVHFPGPFTARMAIRLQIWVGKEKGFERVCNKISDKDWLQYVIPLFDEKQLDLLINDWDIEKLDPTAYTEFRRYREIHTAIFAGLSLEQRKKYFPGFQLEISSDGEPRLRKIDPKVEELDEVKQITDNNS